MRTTEYEDPGRVRLIRELKKAAKKKSARIWDTVAARLSKSRCNRSEVNLSRINLHTEKGDTVVVPGKVLGAGRLDHSVDVAAYKFTEGAREEIKKAGGQVLSISELVKKNNRGSGVKFMG